jgi:hypothetical protein
MYQKLKTFLPDKYLYFDSYAGATHGLKPNKSANWAKMESHVISFIHGL